MRGGIYKLYMYKVSLYFLVCTLIMLENAEVAGLPQHYSSVNLPLITRED